MAEGVSRFTIERLPTRDPLLAPHFLLADHGLYPGAAFLRRGFPLRQGFRLRQGYGGHDGGQDGGQARPGYNEPMAI